MSRDDDRQMPCLSHIVVMKRDGPGQPGNCRMQSIQSCTNTLADSSPRDRCVLLN